MQFANFNRAYEQLDEAAQEMRKGKEKVVENELNQKMALAELTHQFNQFKLQMVSSLAEK